MSSYEFSNQENTQIATLAQKMQRFCYLIGAIGVLSILNPVVTTMRDGGSLRLYAAIVVGLVQIVIAVVIYRPIDNFENIVNTSGNDIGELMTGLGELRNGFNIMSGLIVLNLLLLAVQIFGAMS